MKRFQKQLTAFIAVLLVLCSVLTSCTSTKPNENDTTGGSQGTEEHTHPSETTGTSQQPCTHASTTLVGKKDPTCAIEGYTGDNVCSACGEIVSKGTAIAVIAHVWGEGVQTKNPTCIETGVLTITCSGCGDTKTEPIPTVAHDDKFHDALDGSHNHTCTTCTMNENEQHNPVDEGVAYPATCLEGAYTLLTCADCDGVYKVYGQTDADKATGHQWSAWETLLEASCSAVGEKTRSCPACGETETFELPIDPTAHSFVCVNPTVKPTCAESAVAQYKCNGCNTSKTETLKATGNHSYELQEDKGDGWTRQICSVCDDEIAKFDASNVTIAEVRAEDIPTDTTLAVATQNASISFPAETVSQLTAEIDKKVSIAADVVGETDKNTLIENATNLKEEEKERLKNVDIFDFGVKVGDTPVSNFEAAVTITMPYTLKDGEEPEGILIWYVADDGTTEEVEATYNAENKTVTFSVEHFSFYAVAYKETQAMRCKRGDHDYQIVGEPVPATCETHGYTTLECTGCKKTTVDHFVEKLDHDFGELQPATPTCTEGSWSYKVCDNCGHTVNVTFVRANGHTPDAVATCTTPSTCTTCHEVIAPAKGHSYTEWETVVEPTDVNSGLRRRYCLSCGKVEEMKLAASGNIETLKFESYEHLMQTVITEALNLGNGTIEMKATMNGFTYDFDFTVNSDKDNFLLLMEATQTRTSPEGETESRDISLLYRNGVVIFSNAMDEVFGTDISTATELPFDVYLNYVEQTFDYLNPMVEMVLGQSKEMFTTYIELLGDELNAALKAAGVEYNVEELQTILDSLETVYAYCVLKLGYHTNLEMQDGVRVPTKADLHTVLNALMVPTENADGSKTYTWDITELMEAVNAIVAWVDERIETPVSEVIYELLADTLTETYPELTDWNACVAKIKATFPGTMTVKAMVDLLITVLEENEICTLDELYAIINSIAEQSTGEAFDCKSYVEAYFDQTLNDMIVGMTGEEGVTAEMMYDNFNQQFTTMLLGDIPVTVQGESAPLAQVLEMVQQYLTMLKIEADASITLDAKGNLLALNLNESIVAVAPDGNGGTVEQEMNQLGIAIKHDDTVKVELPDVFKPLTDHTVTSKFDENGNIIINGINPDLDYKLMLEGGYSAPAKDLLKKDEEASKSFGFPVYTLAKELWSDTDSVGRFAVINGKYYQLNHYSEGGKTSIVETLSLTEILSNTDNLLPDTNKAPAGYIEDWDKETGEEIMIPVYDSALGIMWQENGRWMYAQSYSVYTRTSHPDDNSAPVVTYEYDPHESYQYESFSNLTVNIMEDADKYYDLVEGSNIDLKIIRLAAQDDLNYTVLSVYGYVENGAIKVVVTHKTPYRDGYILGEEIAQLPEHDYTTSGSVTNYLYDENGNSEYTTIQTIFLYKKLPTFYVKIDANTYADVNYVETLSASQLNDYQQITLPDGKTLYVVASEKDNNFNDGYYEKGEYYEGEPRFITAGYVLAEGGVCVQTIVFTNMADEIISVVYREGIREIRVSFDDMFDAAQYATKNQDGSVTISAQLIATLKEKCVNAGQFFRILLSGELEEGDKTYSVRHTVMNHVVPEKLTFEGGHSSSEGIYVDWYFWFNGNESGEYSVAVNKDGSLTITLSGGRVVEDISYNAYGEDVLSLDDMLVYNEDMSKQTGLEIYGNLFRLPDTSRTVVLVNGKYYYYSWFDEWNVEYVSTLDEILAETWTIDNMYLRYTIDNNGTQTPVYEASLRFHQLHSNFQITCFLTIDDGKLCALTQAKELGNGILEAEDIVPLEDYIASLKLVPIYDEYSNPSFPAKINGVMGKIYYLYCNLFETDANGDPVINDKGEPSPLASYIGLRVFVDDATQTMHHIGKSTYVGQHLVVENEYIPEAIIESTNSWTETHLNGDFTYVSLSFAHYEYLSFVRLAGKMYRYNGSNGYQENSMSEQEFLEKFADLEWVYAHVPAGEKFDINSNWTAYDIDGKVIDKPEGWVSVYWVKIGSKNNFTVYEVGGYALDKDCITELDDGTVVYTNYNGENFVKSPDGRYVRAYLETDQNGVLHAICDLKDSSIAPWEMDDYQLWDRYITIESNGKITISADLKEILDHLDVFEMIVHTNYYTTWIYADALRAYFA